MTNPAAVDDLYRRLAVLAGVALAFLPGCGSRPSVVSVPPVAVDVAPVSAMIDGAGGVPLHYLDFGGHGAPVVLLAGAGNSAWIYGELGVELAREHRVLALTRRGHGASGQPSTGYDPATLAEDLRLFLDQLGIDRAVLIGHSLAGAELTYFAGAYPARVAALVYLDAAYDRSTQGAMMDADPIPFVAPSDQDRGSAASFRTYVRRTRPDLARYWTAAVERDLDAMIGVRADGTVGWLTLGETFGALIAGASAAPPDYARLQAPVLAIYAVEDEAYRLPADASSEMRTAAAAFEAGPLASWRVDSVAQLRRGVSSAEVVELDAGHHLFLHRPVETLRLIRGFLARQPAAPPG